MLSNFITWILIYSLFCLLVPSEIFGAITEYVPSSRKSEENQFQKNGRSLSWDRRSRNSLRYSHSHGRNSSVYSRGRLKEGEEPLPPNSRTKSFSGSLGSPNQSEPLVRVQLHSDIKIDTNISDTNSHSEVKSGLKTDVSSLKRNNDNNIDLEGSSTLKIDGELDKALRGTSSSRNISSIQYLSQSSRESEVNSRKFEFNRLGAPKVDDFTIVGSQKINDFTKVSPAKGDDFASVVSPKVNDFAEVSPPKVDDFGSFSPKVNQFPRVGSSEVDIGSAKVDKIAPVGPSKIGQYARVGPALEFDRHRIVHPKIIHSRTKRSIFNTIEKGGHIPHITVGINLGEKDVLLNLQLNRDLISKDFFIRSYKDGLKRVQNLTKDDHFCHYQGSIQGVPTSWAAVSTCDGIRGVVFDGTDTHYLEPIPGVTREPSDPIYAFGHTDLIHRNLTCGYKGKSSQSPKDLFQDDSFHRLMRYKRSIGDSGEAPIRGPFNANSLSRFVELVLVADKSEYEKHGSDVKAIHKRFKDIANVVNALYQPLNIFVALVGVEVWTEEDQVEVSSDGDKTLTNFLNYRKVRLIPDHPNDNAQLLTGKSFDSGVVGKALKGPICTFQYSGGVNMDHSDSIGLVATTVAHEMGHNFGMEHDTKEDCHCPDKRCIMAPSSGSRSPSHWSSCSEEYLAISFERSMDYCLRNRPTTLFDSPVCGNGFVEAGEQCDCGLPDRCKNDCCDPNTCMLYPNASCATGHCCDLRTCRPKPAGHECRASSQECDLPEFCSGDSEYCPEDYYEQDGGACQNEKAYCYKGMCRTHELQCRLLWGPTGKNSHDKCYSLNREGNTNGNCGYDWANNTYTPCNYQDVKCGMMHCKHFNERLEFGMESVSKVSHRFIADSSQGGVIPCRVAQVDLGLDMVDPGLAPDGAKCGYNRMCVDQKCLPVASMKKHVCDCNERGVCNNLGNCHCIVGFAPPNCLYPGLGGSINSGPASNPSDTSKFVVGMFVFFLGIVPLVVGIFCFTYYGKGNLKHLWISKGRFATSRFSGKDVHGRTGTLPNSGAKSPTQTDAASSRLRSDTPPSSDESKSNSPLLNGRLKLVDDKGSGAPQLFGKFEGFTLSPIKEKPKCVVNPLPGGPKPFVSSPSSQTSTTGKKVDISCPSLQTSTNPAVKGPAVSVTPTRVAPQPPPSKAHQELPQRPKSVPDEYYLIEEAAEVPPPSSASFEIQKDPGKLSRVARIASFLNKKDKNVSGETASITSDSSQQSNTLPRKAAKINRESLMQLEISNPMQLHATELPNNLVPVRPAPNPPMPNNLKPSEVKSSQEKPTAKVSWADNTKEDSESTTDQFSRVGSVRESTVTPRPVIPKFGSMRIPRPKSLPPARPSQPPPRPPLPAIPGTPEAEYFYDDCITVKFSPSANKDSPQESIYATIDDDSPTTDQPSIQIVKEKKNIFSMLYAKSKKKKKEPDTSEPLYCNIDSSPEHETRKSDSPDRRSAVISDKTSVGSAEDGGLLSEIVSELATREPQYMNTIPKEKAGVSSTQNPVKSVKTPEKTFTNIKKSSTDLTNTQSPTNSQAKQSYMPYANSKPRGVFSFFKNSSNPEPGLHKESLNEEKSNIQKPDANPVTNTVTSAISPKTPNSEVKDSPLLKSLAGVKSASSEIKNLLKKDEPPVKEEKPSVSAAKSDKPVNGLSSTLKSSSSTPNRPVFPPDKMVGPKKPVVNKPEATTGSKTSDVSKRGVSSPPTNPKSKFTPSKNIAQATNLPKTSATKVAGPNSTGRVVTSASTGKITPVSTVKTSIPTSRSAPTPDKRLENMQKSVLPKKSTSADSKRVPIKDKPASNPTTQTKEPIKPSSVALSSKKPASSPVTSKSLTASSPSSTTPSISVSSKNKTLAAAAKPSSATSSNVASLQQKFEKTSQPSKPGSAPVKRPPSGRGRPPFK